MANRIDGRAPDALRTICFEKDFTAYAEGSVLVSFGNTKVLCNVSVENSLPYWIKAEGKTHGWVTGEYAMLPRSTHTRMSRETKGPRGRTQEIQRLVGRSLRAAVNLEALGERSCVVDCDVIQADGGTRTAAISGGYLALRLALQRLIAKGELSEAVFHSEIAAISVGLVDGQPMLDLCYHEDARADTDMNVVMNNAGEFIELQGTAENNSFSDQQLAALLALAKKGTSEIFTLQRAVLASETNSEK